MGEAKRRRKPTEQDTSSLEIVLRGSKEARDKTATRIIELLGPKGDNNYPGESLDRGDGTSRLCVLLKGSANERVAAAKMIMEEVRKLEGQKSVADMTIEELHNEMVFYASNPPPYTEAQMKRGLELAQRVTDLKRDTR